LPTPPLPPTTPTTLRTELMSCGLAKKDCGSLRDEQFSPQELQLLEHPPFEHPLILVSFSRWGCVVCFLNVYF
jgi:hypothetical protein